MKRCPSTRRYPRPAPTVRDVRSTKPCSNVQSHLDSRAWAGTHRNMGPPWSPRWVREQADAMPASLCLSSSARLLRTAHWPGQPLGSAEITHPFHPLRGHQFVVLKVRKVSGVETLSLRHAERGSFAVPREWTDWAPPGTPSEPINGQQPLLFDVAGALALSELVCSLKRKK